MDVKLQWKRLSIWLIPVMVAIPHQFHVGGRLFLRLDLTLDVLCQYLVSSHALYGHIWLVPHESINSWYLLIPGDALMWHYSGMSTQSRATYWILVYYSWEERNHKFGHLVHIFYQVASGIKTESHLEGMVKKHKNKY